MYIFIIIFIYIVLGVNLFNVLYRKIRLLEFIFEIFIFFNVFLMNLVVNVVCKFLCFCLIIYFVVG